MEVYLGMISEGGIKDSFFSHSALHRRLCFTLRHPLFHFSAALCPFHLSQAVADLLQRNHRAGSADVQDLCHQGLY